ncbi:MAG: DNA primase [Lysobacterales bacterium]
MSRIPDAFLDDLLARTDIVEIIEARLPLKRAGRDYKACCPFHDERTPSFHVSPTKQFYHCFGCGAHGSAIKFLMEFDRLEFVDAVEELAARAGVKVPREGGAPRRDQSEFDALLSVLDAAARFFQRQLPGSASAQAYLRKRELDAAMVQTFAIGYAPDSWDALKNALAGDAEKLKLVERAGLLSSGDGRSVYDRFRDRLMFPIHDRRGRVIAFGGRVLGTADGAKYLNSPETPLFQKGRELYGLYQVRQAHAKIRRLIVVEGYLDVISLFQFGITEAVATLGTATTKDHAELLFRNASDVYFCFDGDRAGRSAAWRAVESVLPRMKDGRQAFFLFVPEGEDPDSLVRKDGAAAFEARLQAAQPLSEFFFAHQERETDLGTADGRARLVEKCRALIESIPEGAYRDRMTELLIEKSTLKWSLSPELSAGMRAKAGELLDQRLAAARGQLAAPVAPGTSRLRTPASGPNPRRSLVRTAIALLLQQPSLASAIEPPYLFAVLRQPGVGLLMELIAICMARPEIKTGALLDQFEGREDFDALTRLALLDFPPDAEGLRHEFLDAIAQLNRQTLAQRLDELLERQKTTALSAADKAELRSLLHSRVHLRAR